MISRIHSIQKVLFALFIIASIIISFAGCSSTKQIPIQDLLKITVKSFNDWSIDDCNNIINAQTVSNTDKYLSGSLAYELSGYDVFVSAMPLNDMTIKAMAKKEALLKRLPEFDFKLLLQDYFHNYTNFDYDFETNKLIKKDILEDSLKGLTFQIVFRNNTDPYRPIILENGYEYFFLENQAGEYARVVEISGKFAETDFYLTDYLIVNVTFNSKSELNNLLFKDILSVKEFKLVFNGIDEDPVILEWKLLNNHKGKSK